jgi:superfamily I DNA and/or RNA helicase
MSIKKILDFYEESSLFEKISQITYTKRNDYKQYPFDFISLDNIVMNENGLTIKINKQLEMFLLNNDFKKKGISPISLFENKDIDKETLHELEKEINIELDILFPSEEEKESQEYIDKLLSLKVDKNILIDKNRLLFSPLYIKLNKEEESRTIFIPILFIDISNLKQAIKNHPYKDSDFELNIDLNETDFIYNDFATTLFFNENMKELFNNLLYVSNSDEINDKEIFFKKIYSELEKKLNDFKYEFKIELPKVNSSKIEPICLFFNKEDKIDIKEDFELLKFRTNNLLKTFLTKKEEKNKFKDSYYLGSLTNQYTLSLGQSEVLQKNQNEIDIISVFGGPGTGKTSLVLSLIANNVVKRAIKNIYENKDYNNLTLITSTSNKAIENITESLEKATYKDIFYLGGNSTNRKNSEIKIKKIIENFSKAEFSEETFKDIENKIKKTVDKIKKSNENFKKIKHILKHELNINSLKNLEAFKISYKENIKREIAILKINELKEYPLNSLNSLLSLEETFSFYIDFIESKNYFLLKKASEKIENINFFQKIIKSDTAILTKFNDINKNYFNISDIDILIEITSLLNILDSEKKELKEALKELEYIEKLEKLKQLDIEEVEKVLKYNTYGEYFKEEFSMLNYELFILSKNYLEMKALKNKFSIIDSLKYLASGNMYHVKDTNSFLKEISLLIPVFTSTLAGFKYMFNNLNKNNTDYIYETLICDEAAMVKITDILTPITDSKRAILVGDPKQLPPIVNIDNLFKKYLESKFTKEDKSFYKKYSITEISAFHRAAGCEFGGYLSYGDSIILDEHRRCQKPIAELFMKVAEYENIKIKTNKIFLEDILPFKKNTYFFNIDNKEKKDILINKKEVDFIERLIDFLENNFFDIKKDIGIITPYVKQEEYLIKRIGSKIGHSYGNKKIGTVHKFQGTEFKIIIFSTVISSNQETLAFINKDPSMVNVAISRAKELFLVVGDYKKLSGTEPGNYIGRMATQMRSDIIKDISEI